MGKTTKYALLISLLTYLLFYFKMLVPGQILYSGTDSSYYHHPRTFHLFERLQEGNFPFWTEKIFSGFPVYADIESSYINPIHVSFVMLFGPIWSIKLQHFFFYMIGSMAFYHLLNRKGISVLGFAAANLIYFFSFFMVLHHQHINMLFTAFMLPVPILLFDLFFEKKKVKHLLAASLIAALLFFYGSTQMVIITLIGMTIYYLFYFKGSLTKKQALVAFALFTGLFLTLILPLALPASQLYLRSARALNPHSYLQGSFLPINFLTTLYPLLFTDGTDYIGLSIINEFFKHEIYVYVGVSGFMLAFMGFFTKTNRKFTSLLNTYILVFLLLGFAKYIPLVNQIEPPLLSSFRFWGRSVVLFNFAIAAYAGIFLTNLGKNVRFDKHKVQLLLGTLATFIVFQLVYFRDRAFLITARYLINEVLSGNFFDIYFFAWASVVLVTFILIYYKPKRWAQFVVLVLALDLLLFTDSVAINAYRKIDGIIPAWNIPRECAEKRCARLDEVNVSNREMYFDTWSVFGYTEFVSKDYSDALRNAGYRKVRLSAYDKGLKQEEVVDNLYKLGVYGVYDREEFSVVNESFPLAHEVPGLLGLYYGEGYLSLATESAAPAEVYTLVRKYPGWELEINGKQAEFMESEGLFLSFELPAGSATAEMKYRPVHFHQGLTLMLVLLGFEFVLFRVLRVREYVEK